MFYLVFLQGVESLMLVDYWKVIYQNQKKQIKKKKFYIFLFIILPAFVAILSIVYFIASDTKREKKYNKIQKRMKKFILENEKFSLEKIDVTGIDMSFMTISGEDVQHYTGPNVQSNLLDAKMNLLGHDGRGELWLIIRDRRNNCISQHCLYNSTISRRKLCHT